MSALPSIAEYWDSAADSFDQEADHGLRDPRVRAAWAERLSSWMPAAPADVLDAGCGTGSLSLLLAERGHRVVGVDLSPNMAGHARRKLAAAGFDARFLVGDTGDLTMEASTTQSVQIQAFGHEQASLTPVGRRGCPVSPF